MLDDRFRASKKGNVAVMTAVLLPALLLAVGAGVDLQRWGSQRARLQEFADMLALRGAREFLLANTSASQIESVVQSIADSSLPDDLEMAPFTIDVDVNAQDAAVTVSLAQPAPRGFILSHVSSLGEELSVASTAVARGGMNVCVVALQDSGVGAVSTNDDALLDATPCSVLSNSTSSAGIAATGASEIRAGLICSAGGADGTSANFTPEPTTDCPVYEDPLAGRPAPAVGACNEYNFEAGYTKAQSSGSDGGGLVGGVLGGVTDVVEGVASIVKIPLVEIQINPGVYCGGIKVKFNARAVFKPGIYVIKDGPLAIGKYSELKGQNVAFYLLGDTSTFTFDRDAKVTMSAPKSGPLAGILFFEDRNAPLNRVHAIYSEDAREFLGTFYLPRGVLRVDTQNPVADASAYTALVVRKLELAGAPTLVLNADYSSTDVPVPDGVGPVGGEVFLRD